MWCGAVFCLFVRPEHCLGLLKRRLMFVGGMIWCAHGALGTFGAAEGVDGGRQMVS